MRLCITLLLSIVCSIACYSQNSTNNLNVTANTSFNYVCNSISTLENSQTTVGALTVAVKSKSTACSIYAKISSFIGPSGFTTSTYPIQLDYTSTNASGVSNLISSALTLTSADQRLFSQSKNGATFYYYYNLILTGVGYSYPVGHYNFTIMFTMTQP
ncbi:MAG: hypothetical protein JST82_03170 [Bacteroidetes bacterium]|nr:hypothetical protein [Bacteroidota bacterium]